MRVISQDGTIDIPYESVIIQRFGGEIYFLNKNLIGVEQLVSDMDIATYSTEENAQKAMEMLHDAYLGKDKGYHDEYGNVLYHHAQTTDSNIFQFPKDEDVEE